MNIIEELFYGNINPNEKPISINPEYDKCVDDLFSSEEKLTDLLKSLPNSKENIALFENVLNSQGNFTSLVQKESFTDGFKLGARFMLDTFDK